MKVFHETAAAKLSPEFPPTENIRTYAGRDIIVWSATLRADQRNPQRQWATIEISSTGQAAPTRTVKTGVQALCRQLDAMAKDFPVLCHLAIDYTSPLPTRDASGLPLYPMIFTDPTGREEAPPALPAPPAETEY